MDKGAGMRRRNRKRKKERRKGRETKE